MYWPRIATNFNELDSLLDQMKLNVENKSTGQTAVGGSPKLNVWTKKDSAVVTAEVPGLKPQDLIISAYENKMTVEGEFKDRQKGIDEVYHRGECANGKFRRELALPFKIDTSKIVATCKNGVVQINILRAEEDKPKVITVKAA